MRSWRLLLAQTYKTTRRLRDSHKKDLRLLIHGQLIETAKEYWHWHRISDLLLSQ